MRTGRIRTRAEFTALRQRGVRSRQRSVRVTYLPGAPDVRVAFAVGRPVGSAVARNRLRRRLRALLAELQPPAGSYLIAAGPGAATSTFADLRDELAAAVDEVAHR
jgi:ribonuclease P protein component